MVLALGYFDGVHTGHQEVIRTAAAIAAEKNCALGVMTFHPHPKVVLSAETNENNMRYLTPLSHKEECLQEQGPDYLFVVQFDKQFASKEPQEFVDQYLIGLQAVHVTAGFDYSYGRLGRGTMETLPFHSRGRFGQTIVGEVTRNGEKISSTAVKECIQTGDIEKAGSLLGRPYSIRGVVEGGEQRGRTIGFPTANIHKHDLYIVPAPGVYAVRIYVGGRWLDGAASIGFKPTFHDEAPEDPVIEVYIFDFNQDIYGENVEVCFYTFIRGEETFNSAEELIEEMNRDVEKARTVLAARSDVPGTS
ncbi:riboflavin kinase / FMN adenylyltransferase [Salibacterium halotolerans]|uniref:Riboflavin biosynthesis protein n=2 Tax=Salibacterium halotolerans TaxID=1884432 RepID=A0A1I5MHG7_9BACI|nr:riboflavin biosynthesis protein RibF [Salibacterium halotolerans]SFP08969.1 riboflavin kinase / FMN adenylyltransferase [Salibacterium halotolerans]